MIHTLPRQTSTSRLLLAITIPLAAAFALLGAGPMWGFAVFFLVFPAILMSARFRVT